MRGIRGGIFLGGLVVLALLGSSFLFGGPRSAVSWSDLRAVAIESDDWGLPGFVPGTESWQGLDRTNLGPGNFPAVYWLSTLEDSAMMANLNLVLGSHTGRDGHPAIMQPNYVMSSLAYSAQGWASYDLPDLPPEYSRPGLWVAVARGIGSGTWYPEFHAAWHYDPDLRKSAALETDLARLVTERGIMLFPGSEKARELGSWRSLADLTSELDQSLAVFHRLFKRRVGSVMAPDYHWNDRVEELWLSRGLKVIQGKREQRNPAWGGGSVGRARKYLHRRWVAWTRSDRMYLERNCRLEPAQAPEDQDVAVTCALETRQAWRRGQPAIVESHRVNFVHTDPVVVNGGLGALDRYLDEISGNLQDLPLFLTDHEIAQLYSDGTSWCVRGSVVVVRNGTKGTKIVHIPADAWASVCSGAQGDHDVDNGLWVAVPADSSFDLVP